VLLHINLQRGFQMSALSTYTCFESCMQDVMRQWRNKRSAIKLMTSATVRKKVIQIKKISYQMKYLLTYQPKPKLTPEAEHIILAIMKSCRLTV